MLMERLRPLVPTPIRRKAGSFLRSLSLAWRTWAYERNKAQAWDNEYPDFEDWKRSSQPSWDSHWEMIHRHLLPIVRANGVTRAVDLGCGKGWLSRKLAPHFDQVYAIDIGPKRLEFARESSSQFTNIRFICADAAQAPKILPLGERYFFVTMAVLSHNSPRAVERILRWVDSVCAAGSVVYFNEAWSLRRAAQVSYDWWWHSLPKTYDRQLAGWDLTFYGISSHPNESIRAEGKELPLRVHGQRIGKGIFGVKVQP